MALEKVEHLYSEIAVQVSNMIPEPWGKVYVYAEMAEGYRSVLFYYVPEESGDPVYCHDITKKFEVPTAMHDAKENTLSDLVKSLWVEFQKPSQQPWSTMTFIFDNTGSFTVEYGYEDVLETDSVLAQVVWEYKHLGLVPTGGYRKRVFDEYLESQRDKS